MSLRPWLLTLPAWAVVLSLAWFDPGAAAPLDGPFSDVPIPTDGAQVQAIDAARVELVWPDTPWRVVQERTHGALKAQGWSQVDHKPLPAGSTTSWERGGRRVGLILSDSRGGTRAMVSVEPSSL